MSVISGIKFLPQNIGEEPSEGNTCIFLLIRSRFLREVRGGTGGEDEKEGKNQFKNKSKLLFTQGGGRNVPAEWDILVTAQDYGGRKTRSNI